MAGANLSKSKARSTRRAHGVYYTPAPVVRYIVNRTLAPLPAEATVLDPACGAGAFLTEAYRQLLDARLTECLAQDASQFVSKGVIEKDAESSAGWQLTSAERRRVLLEQVFGVELDPQAAHQTRLALANLALPADESETPSAARGYTLDKLLAALEANIRQGDALVGPDLAPGESRTSKGKNRPKTFDWHAAFPQVVANGGGFDAIVMNPPYLNIRLVSQAYDAGVKHYFESRYRCARGNYDLYVLFIEKAFELLRAGGQCGMITPNKLATLDYAADCRELLTNETTIHHVADVSGLSIFPEAGVYPYIMVWEKTPPDPQHLVRVLRARSVDDLVGEPLVVRLAQTDLTIGGGMTMHGGLDVESRVPTATLESQAKLHSGATGFVAQTLAAELVESDDLPADAASYEFIVSGNIDRYLIEPGDVRFMKRSFARPVLPKSARSLSANKRELYAGAKIVIAGMTRRLEAAFDPGGLALGVQVYAAADCADDPRYLLAILNSKLLSYLFRTRFRAKELAGGFLAINKGQLATLPIRLIDEQNPTETDLRDRLIAQVDVITRLHEQRRHEFNPQRREQLGLCIGAADSSLDELVFRLYRLSAAEIEKVEREYQTPGREVSAA